MQDQPNRLCACGCGREISSTTTRGKLKRYVAGHSSRWVGMGPEYEVAPAGYATSCWLWQRSCNSNGYGQVRIAGADWPVGAHRVYWERTHGPVPEGHELDHLCRNTRCVNPEHLEPVSHAENMRRGKNTLLTLEIAREIRASTDDAITLAKRYGVSRRSIYSVRNNDCWREP